MWIYIVLLVISLWFLFGGYHIFNDGDDVEVGDFFIVSFFSSLATYSIYSLFLL